MNIDSLNDLPSVRAYLSRIGAEPRSLKTAIIKEQHGNYWKDVATIRFDKSGVVKSSDDRYDPTDAEKEGIARDFSTIIWPTIKKLTSIIKPPAMISEADPADVFEFRDEEGKIIMIQVRVERESGKNYVPWTYWDDDKWRASEPDGPLPLYNGEKLTGSTTVFVHEGAKAARNIQRMVDGKTPQDRADAAAHPWGLEMMGAVHVGWIGGALSPYRTDWSALFKAGVKRVYIVADNDSMGRSAVPGIAQQIRIPTFMIQFTDEFPGSFDLADEFPKKMFANTDGESYYTGPAFRDCLHPATWATDLIPNQKGKPTVVLRDAFSGMWAYIEEADVFVCTEMPEIMRSEAILNKMLSAFSHTSETSKLITKRYRGRSARICYRPDEKGLMVTFRGSSAINLHVPPVIRAKKGDIKPWLEFLEYVFVKEGEREQIKRWCATLIAKPEIRIGYGLLLVSERQGIGKTTLGSMILAPLVGHNNVGFPNENDIMGSFNDWMANKRLVVVNEIYSGASWKAYHALKSVITDKDVSVNQKYMRPYNIENWCHVVACSNSMRALKMENDDRRWFYPEITEVPWPQEKFDKFRSWLERGGLSIIKYWAQNFGNYVRPSERAPMTDRKVELIDGSRSDAQKEAVALAEALRDRNEPGGILIKEVVGFVRNATQGKVFDTDYELRRAMVDVGLYPYEKRIKVAGRLQYVIMNAALKSLVQSGEEEAAPAMIRANIVHPTDLIQSEM